MDGTPTTLERLTDAKILTDARDAQFSANDAMRHAWNCGAQRMHVPNAGYVRDVCATIDSRSCPFLPEKK